MAKLVFQLQGAGWKVVATFEGNFPSRIKQLPLDRHFDINNVKRVSYTFMLHLIRFCCIYTCLNVLHDLIVPYRLCWRLMVISHI